MLGQLPAEEPIEAVYRASVPSLEGFMAKALKISGKTASALGKTLAYRRRRDFVRALNILGATSKFYRLGSNDPLPRTVPLHISCPYQTWIKVFGRPEDVEKHSAGATPLGIHLWKHSCNDGPVTCIGQISERLPGLRWIVVVRVGLYW
jgi:hypothetical protein